MNTLLQTLPILFLSIGLVVVSANCYWLCQRINKLEMRLFNVEHPPRAQHFDHAHYDIPKEGP